MLLQACWAWWCTGMQLTQLAGHGRHSAAAAALHRGSGSCTARCPLHEPLQALQHPCTGSLGKPYPLYSLSHSSIRRAGQGTCCPNSHPKALQYHRASPKKHAESPQTHAPQSLAGGTAAAAPPGPGSWTRCSRTGRPHSPPGSPGPHTWPGSARSHLAAARSAECIFEPSSREVFTSSLVHESGPRLALPMGLLPWCAVRLHHPELCWEPSSSCPHCSPVGAQWSVYPQQYGCLCLQGVAPLRHNHAGCGCGVAARICCEAAQP